VTSFVLDLSGEFERLRAELRDELLAELREQLAAEAWPGWLDVPTAAKYMSVSPERVRKLIARNAIPYSQEAPGCRVLIERRALDQHLRHRAGGGLATT